MLKSNFLNIVHMLNKKEIHVKDIFLLFLIVISLSFWVIYTSFAIFTNTLNKSNVASIILEVPNYKIESTSTLFDNQTKQIIIPANESIRFDVDITSTSMGNTKYKLYYEMVSPTSLPETLTVGVNSFSDNPRTANIAFNNTETKNVDIEVLNSGDSAVTLKFDVMGGYVNNEVVLPENKFELIEFSPTTSVTKKSNTNQITLKEATEGNLSGYQIFGSTEQENLPTEYQEVEYIESTGTQYIDTGFVPNNKTQTKIKFASTKDGVNGALLGSRITSLSKEYRIQVSNSQDQTIQSIHRVFNNQMSGYTSSYYLWTKDTVYEIDFGSTVTINGVTTDTFTDTTFTTPGNLYLFCFNGNGTATSFISAKVYYTKIYDNGVLVRNMIPAYRKSDNVIGMYDLVNNIFYTNAGTGDFTKGGNVSPTPTKPVSLISLGESGSFDVISSGKNLFSSTHRNIDFTVLSTTHNISTQFGTNYYSYFVPCKPNTTYTISRSNTVGPYFVVGYITAEPVNNLPLESYTQNDTALELTITTNSSAKYIGVFFGSANGVSDNIQIEEGLTATTYEAYKEQKTTIDLLGHEPLRKIGDVADYVDYKNNKIVRNVRKVVFNGSENWYAYGSNVALGGWDNALTPIHTYDRKLQGYKCNIATETTTMSLTENNNTFATHNVSTDSNDWIVFHINNTVDDWKAYLAEQYAKGTPVVVYHKLATPDDTETITLPQISTFSGTNIFRILNGGLNVTYTKNT